MFPHVLIGGKATVLFARIVNNFVRHLNSFHKMTKIHCHIWFD